MGKAKHINLIMIAVILCLFVLTISTVMAQEDKESIGNENSIKIKLIVYGVERQVETPALTVNNFLSAQDVMMLEDDELNMPMEYILKNNDTIRIYDVKEKEEKEMQDIAYEVETVQDTSMAAGTSKVVQRGIKGQAEVTYKSIYKDNAFFSKTEIKRETLKESVKEIVHVGTKRTIEGQTYTKSFTVKAVAYNLSGSTAIGMPVRHGIIAVDPSIIPLGSKVYVEGYGFAIAADVGGAIKGNKIDLWMPTYADCMQWGARDVQIYILG